MQLPDLKQLDKMIALCRKRGVKVIKIGELELTLSDEAPVTRKSATSPAQAKPSQFNDNPETDGWDALSEEERLFWSSGPALPTDTKSES